VKTFLAVVGMIAYELGSVATLGYLLFFDGTVYTWWNWLPILGLDVLLSQLWLFYWPIHLLAH